MRDIDELFNELPKSSFRSGIGLTAKEREYLNSKGMRVVLDHAADFVDKRLAPAYPANDGKQTPRRNHPVFVAQHATATCCRGCLEKWHHIPKGRELNSEERKHVLRVIERWLSRYETGEPGPAENQSTENI
jgi:hypothetical protein